MMFIGLTFSSSSETARALNDHPLVNASGFGLAAGSEFAILCLLADGFLPISACASTRNAPACHPFKTVFLEATIVFLVDYKS
jgi:hypothetical protein